MAETGINNLTGVFRQSSNTSFSQAATKNTLGKQEFLNLLVTQLRYQDPLKPMEDKEFVAQLAQFSALEQMQNLNESFELVKAQGLIGRYVVATNPSDTSKTLEGRVDSIRKDGSKVYLNINGVEVSTENVKQIYHTYAEEVLADIMGKIPTKDDLLEILNSLQKGESSK
ncbi:flagellar hook capping FlgD N-terminal domain-containing protein [Caldicellulosiruptor morganii]|uniref:Flagellar hook capping protein n=1 Tax=Caldicellulosiruptor morganii TaxID=1387555 RepID=A0ABY7BKS9_9FIRM|nr:flagellar hook capping FlgD N-terminal domain-containing protein [Caldicellulosiruptor morganii]WAM33447.1 flagellar hook capping protein [Caldicellulosiruptor morganii]